MTTLAHDALSIDLYIYSDCMPIVVTPHMSKTIMCIH